MTNKNLKQKGKTIEKVTEEGYEHRAYPSVDLNEGSHKYILVGIRTINEDLSQEKKSSELELRIIGANENEHYHMEILKRIFKEIEKKGYIRDREKKINCFGKTFLTDSPEKRVKMDFGYYPFSLYKDNEVISGTFMETKVYGGGWADLDLENKIITLHGKSGSFTKSYKEHLDHMAKYDEKRYLENTKDNDVGTHSYSKKLLEKILGKEYTIRIPK